MIQLRQQQGRKQSDVARAVKAQYGFPFHQQTIQRIETGERPVRLNEALALADILYSDLETMLEDSVEAADFVLKLTRAENQAEQIYGHVQRQIAGLDDALRKMLETLAESWAAYEVHVAERGEVVDHDLSAGYRRLTSRVERAIEGIYLIGELDDI